MANPHLHVLTGDDLRLLRDSIYDFPVRVLGRTEKARAKRLLDLDLLERDPTAGYLIVRRSPLGDEAARPLTVAGVRRLVASIRREWSGDREMATSISRNLFFRIAAEASILEDGYMTPGALAKVAREAMRLLTPSF